MPKKEEAPQKLSQKHFLDTSVLRPILLGTAKYRDYFKTQFRDESLYVSAYVKMEFARSFIVNCIDFYFTLDMPDIKSYNDAANYWANKFKQSELKAIIQLFGNMLANKPYDRAREKDKQSILRDIGFYIKRLELKLRRSFADIGKDGTKCFRATRLNIFRLSKRDIEKLRQFQKEFLDEKTCRKNCSVHVFLLNKYKETVAIYESNAKMIQHPGHKENIGFVKIVAKLGMIREIGPDSCSCHMCKKIGDAIIALDGPREMVIECTDHSFDHLCRPIGQPFKKHPSEISLFQKLPV